MTATEHVKDFLPEQIVEDKRLGRAVVHHDPASRAFGIRPVLESALPPAKQAWWRRGVFDQGSESSCTAQGMAGLLLTSPLRAHAHVRERFHLLNDGGYRYRLYRRAQREFDPWPNEEPAYFGTSTLAIFKAAKAEGLVPESWQYRWCFSWEDVRDTLARISAVVAGTIWVEGFDHPRKSDGLVRLEGEERGGHLWELVHYDEADDEVVGVNSWGTPYGKNGRFRMKRKTFMELQERNGEVALWVPS